MFAAPTPFWVVEQFGTFSDFVDKDGFSATDACCTCGGGWTGPEAEPEPEPEPFRCDDDPGGALAAQGTSCQLAVAPYGGNCSGVTLFGFNVSALCPNACNFGCGYIPSGTELINAALGRRRVLQDSSADIIDPAFTARQSRPKRFGWFFNVAENVDTSSIAAYSTAENARRIPLLGGEDVLQHSIQLVHLPYHPEEFRLAKGHFNTSQPLPTIFNLTCASHDEVPQFSSTPTNVTILYRHTNGSIPIETPVVTVSWRMRGACPTLALHAAKDTSTRTSLTPIINALQRHSVGGFLCALIVVGWLGFCVLRHGHFLSPDASELYPFRKTFIIPGVLSREDLAVTWHREGLLLKVFICVDVVGLLAVYLLMTLGGLVSLAKAVSGASEVCSTDGEDGIDHPAGNMWITGRRLCVTCMLAQLFGIASFVAYIHCRRPPQDRNDDYADDVGGTCDDNLSVT